MKERVVDEDTASLQRDGARRVEGREDESNRRQTKDCNNVTWAHRQADVVP
jgi:hypothetical protein